MYDAILAFDWLLVAAGVISIAALWAAVQIVVVGSKMLLDMIRK